LEELRRARETHRRQGRDLTLRCFFLEHNRDAYSQLRQFADKVTDVEIRVLNVSFEDSVSAVLDFIRTGGTTFPFIFIDPTGWTGFALKNISPLLKLDPGEVLVNFMTSHIRRFLRDEGSLQSFIDLFGSADFREQVSNLSGMDLEDAAVFEYIRSLQREGHYPYVLPSIVLHPELDRTHFHLIYATRHIRGVEVFKGAEKAAMSEMGRVRAVAQSRRQEERTGQKSLFASAEAPQSRHYTDLRERYLRESRERVLDLLTRSRRILYDEAWALALGSPLVWESDLKDWIKDWHKAGVLQLQGLQGRESVPKQGQSHFLLWQGTEKGRPRR